MAADPKLTQQIGHLLRRAGFGATPDEISTYAAKGLQATVDQLLNFDDRPDGLDPTLNQIQGDLIDLHNLIDVQTWWVYRMLHTTNPLQEKMTLFWHGHFATANYKVNNPLFMHNQNATQRKYALGNFRDLVTAMAKDPAMLEWLDGNTNRKGAPNENFARELMELFTLGIGNYTEDDVQAGARAFTGWNLDRKNGQYVFNANQHDAGVKTFRGVTGNLNGDDVINNVVADSATAKRIAGKLFSFFAYDNPEPEVVQPLADLYLKSKLEIKPVVQAILTSDAFYSDKSMQTHIKSPVEFAVGSVRSLGGKVSERNLAVVLSALGQDLYNPPNVAGWPGGPDWMNAATMATRFNFGGLLAGAIKGAQNQGGGYIDPEAIVQSANLTNWDSIISFFGGALTSGLTDQTTQTLKSFTAPTAINSASAQATLRGLLHLLLVTPEYQVA